MYPKIIPRQLKSLTGNIPKTTSTQRYHCMVCMYTEVKMGIRLIK